MIQLNRTNGEATVPFIDENGDNGSLIVQISGKVQPSPVEPPAELTPKFSLFGYIPGIHPNPVRAKEVIKYRSGAYSPITKLITCAPYADDRLLIIDPFNETAERTESTRDFGSSIQKWVGNVTDARGRHFFFSHKASKGMLVYDPATGAMTSHGHAMQTRSGDIDKHGVLHLFNFSGGASSMSSVRRFNTLTDEWMTTLKFEIGREDPIYKLHPDWKRWNGPGVYDSQWGFKFDKTGTVGCSSPFCAARPIVVDVDEGTAVQADSPATFTGEFPPPLKKYAEVHYSSTYWSKYSGSTLSSITGEIIAFPRKGDHIQIFNPTTKTFRYISLPSPITDDKLSRSFGSTEGPEGLICSVLWHSKYFFTFNPETDEVKHYDMSPIIEQLGNHNLYFADLVYVPELKKLYAIPARSESVLVIEFM